MAAGDIFIFQEALEYVFDGGFGADFLPFVGPCPPGATPGVDVCIPFPSQTQDGIDNLDQFTQELRLASNGNSTIDWLVGAFLIARREAVRAVGPLDERFFLYYEEVDLCRRIKASRRLTHHIPMSLREGNRQGTSGQAVTS